MFGFRPTLSHCLAVLIGAMAVASLEATPLDYSSVPGSSIRFDGHSHFQFSSNGPDFEITSGGAAAGLLGSISGLFSIGNVTTEYGLSTAPVSGSGIFTINDGAGFTLSGNLTWVSIAQFGAGDYLNTSGSVNLTDITYAGSVADLQTLAASPARATDVLSFQFAPARTLASLKSSAATTSFSGSIQPAPDAGSALILLGLGLGGLLALSLTDDRSHSAGVGASSIACRNPLHSSSSENINPSSDHLKPQL